MKTKKILSFILSVVIMLGACMCTVSADDARNGIVHNIAGKYSGENLAEDANMMWFVADIAVYEQVYQKTVITPVIEQICVDKIIKEADETTYPSVLAKSIISLRALGYDAKNTVNEKKETVNIVSKLTDMVDAEAQSVLNVYTLPYVILALQQGNNYATDDQMDYLIEKAVESKAMWQDTTWGTDAATPMLVALAPYYSTNQQIKNAIDETVSLVASFQNEDGLINNAASHGLAMTAFSALGIDNHSIENNGKDMFDGLMTTASAENDGFEPSYNSFSTEQGFRGLLSTMLPEGTRIYDFADYPYNQAIATWAEFAPVSFNVVPEDALVTVTGALPVEKNKYDLQAGTYNYSVSHSVYQPKNGTFVITPEEADNHIPKDISVRLDYAQSSGGADNQIKVKIKVMVHDKEKCNNSFTYKNNSSSYTGLINETLTLKKGDNVLTALGKALGKNNISYVERNGYVSEINGIKEFDHGNNSGWMFLVDGKHQTKGCKDTFVSDGQEIVWFYTDDYNVEKGSESFSSGASKSEIKDEDWGLEGKIPDIKKRKIENKGKTFKDIKNHEKQTVIEALAERKIINGKSEERFDPDGLMTRSEFAAILVNGLCLPEKTGKNFDDVLSTDWHYDYINTAYAYGIVKGESETVFNPDGMITKEEAAVMLSRAARLCGLDTKISQDGIRNILAQFTDYKAVSEWAENSLAFCYGKKILPDGDLEIKPFEQVTRAQIADMLYNMLLLAKLL